MGICTTTDDKNRCAKIGTERSYIPGSAIAEDPTSSTDGTVRSEFEITTEGQDLLDALKRFAASLVHSPNSKQMERQLLGNSDKIAGVSSRCTLGLPRSMVTM